MQEQAEYMTVLGPLDSLKVRIVELLTEYNFSAAYARAVAEDIADDWLNTARIPLWHWPTYTPPDPQDMEFLDDPEIAATFPAHAKVRAIARLIDRLTETEKEEVGSILRNAMAAMRPEIRYERHGESRDPK